MTITLPEIEKAVAHQPHFQRLVHELGDHWSQAAYAALFVKQWHGAKGEITTTDAEVQEAAAALGLPTPVVKKCQRCGGGECDAPTEPVACPPYPGMIPD